MLASQRWEGGTLCNDIMDTPSGAGSRDVHTHYDAFRNSAQRKPRFRLPSMRLARFRNDTTYGSLADGENDTYSDQIHSPLIL